jgi:uncharacterized protein
MKHLASFFAGLLFAAGLVAGGMTQPAKVVGFLDVTGGGWDPSLAFVMGGALVVYGVAFRLITGMKEPIFGPRFQIPSRGDLPPRLFVGAALFGIGWGLSGFCPGPAIVGVGSGMVEALLFLPGMLVGMGLFRAWDGRGTRRTADSDNGAVE